MTCWLHRCQMPFETNIEPMREVGGIASTIAVRVTKGGVQYTFWAAMGYAPHDHMERAFTQRREQIVGDNLQLRIDVDVYNDMNSGQRPEIQLVLDYTDDIAERLALIKMKPKKVEVA